MPIEILMPALSPTMEEGTLAKWHVKQGDSISPGDVIAEIETDKATMEVEAVDEGRVAKILVSEGAEGVKVNSVIALLAEEGEDVSAAPAPAAPVAANGNGGGLVTPMTRPAPAVAPSGPVASVDVADPQIRRGRRWSRRCCATPCATPWPRRCAGTRACS